MLIPEIAADNLNTLLWVGGLPEKQGTASPLDHVRMLVPEEAESRFKFSRWSTRVPFGYGSSLSSRNLHTRRNLPMMTKNGGRFYTYGGWYTGRRDGEGAVLASDGR